MQEIRWSVKVNRTNWMKEMIQNQTAVKMKRDTRVAKQERGKKYMLNR